MNESQLVRVGAVSFLNALPLIEGLDDLPHISLTTAVPSRLPVMLTDKEVDVALVPVIDIARPENDWQIVSDACIACDGPTLTVRVFSRTDPADVEVLYADCDSHSSVALASIIWREKFDRTLKVLPFPAGRSSPKTLNECQAVLLIGDKVIQPPAGLEVFSTTVDLGSSWKSLTGLPFVFAAWAAPKSEPSDRIAQVLIDARNTGVARAADIAAAHATQMGWPVELATKYLTEYLTFTFTDRHREGMQRFLDLARRYDLIPSAKEPMSA